jgi:hypothetical protein
LSSLDVDRVLQRRIPTRLVARYLGCSVRQVQEFIREGLLEAADMRSAKATRPAWVVTVASVRRLLIARELKKEAHTAQGAKLEGEKPAAPWHGSRDNQGGG